MKRQTMREHGFSLLELMVATLLFTIIAGVVFLMLQTSQTRYQTEKEYTVAFQQANVAMDQIARDVHTAGYPPANSFNAVVAMAFPGKVAVPFPWSPNYPAAACTMGGNCTTPGAFDLIMEADLGNGVQWIRYNLGGPTGTTLRRGMTAKVPGVDPLLIPWEPLMYAYVDNVMNNASVAQMARLRNSYPALFPGNASVPIFTYTYDPGTATEPRNIREVNITLIVESLAPDLQTRQPRLAVLTGQATRVNPNQ